MSEQVVTLRFVSEPVVRRQVRSRFSTSTMSAVLAVALILVATACGTGDSATGPERTSTSTSTDDAARSDEPVPKAMLDAPGWMLREAIDGPPVIGSSVPLTTDWYAEYQRLEPDAKGQVGAALKLSGIRSGLGAYRAAMERLGVSFRPVNTAMGPGLSGTTDENGARPVIVAVPSGSGTLELLSYDQSAEELIALVSNIKMAS